MSADQERERRARERAELLVKMCPEHKDSLHIGKLTSGHPQIQSAEEYVEGVREAIATEMVAFADSETSALQARIAELEKGVIMRQETGTTVATYAPFEIVGETVTEKHLREELRIANNHLESRTREWAALQAKLTAAEQENTQLRAGNFAEHETDQFHEG